MAKTKKPMKTDMAAKTKPIFAMIMLKGTEGSVKPFNWPLRTPPRMKRMMPGTYKTFDSAQVPSGSEVAILALLGE